MWLVKIARSLETLIALLNAAVHKIGLIVLLLLMLLTVGDVIGRYFFEPVTGTYELTGLMLAVIVFFGLGYAQIKREHIRIDVIAQFLSPRKEAILDSIVYLVSSVIFSLVVWQLIEHALRLWSGNVVTGVLSWPIYPFVISAAFGCSLFSLVLLLQFIHALAKLVRHEP